MAVRLITEFDVNFVGYNVPPGEYLVEHAAAPPFLQQGECFIETVEKPVFDATQDWNGKRVLIIRPGGFGDLLFLTPIMRRMKELWPTIHIACGAFPSYLPALQELDFVNEILRYPFDTGDCKGWDGVIWLESLIEFGEDAKTKHAIDLYADYLGIELEDKSMVYNVSEEEAVWAAEHFPKKRKHRLSVQFSASSPVRTYPADKLLEVCREMVANPDYEVFLYGQPGQLKQIQEIEGKVYNLSARNLSFRQSCAVLADSDVVLAPDSALCHVAGALNIPTVALYGPFPWQVRTTYAPTVRAINGPAPCAPCFHHSRPGVPWPKNGPCVQANRCTALDAIEPKRIVSLIKKQCQRSHPTPISSGPLPVS